MTGGPDSQQPPLIFPQTKCLSDRVLNYLFQIENRLFVNEDNLCTKIRFHRDMMVLYYILRVDTFFGNHNPKSIAAALAYKICKDSGNMYCRRDITLASDVTEDTLTNNLKHINKHLKLTKYR